MRKVVVGWFALACALAFSIASYGRLPAELPIHWNIEFEPNGWGPKFLVAIVVPIAFMFLPLVGMILPRIDPRRDSYDLHTTTYWFIWNAVLILLAALQVLTIGLGLGWNVDPARIFPFLIGVLFLVLGNVATRVRPNWFVGIRTPWTLSSDEVWRRTHRVGGISMMLAGAVMLPTAIGGPEVVRSVAWVVALVLAAAVPVVYSYIAWRAEGRPRRSKT